MEQARVEAAVSDQELALRVAGGSDPAAETELVQRLAPRLAGELERSVLVLTFYAEAPAGEIAARLGLSPDNVRTVRHRAFGRLRRCVEGGAA